VSLTRWKSSGEAQQISTIVLTIVGLIVVVYLLFATGHFAIPRSGENQTILSIVGGFVFANAVQLGTWIVQTLRDRVARRQFASMFGRDEIVGIVPEYVCSPELGAEKLVGNKPIRTTGVKRVVPTEDIQAAAKLAHFFDAEHMKFTIEGDSRRPPNDIPKEAVITIGLGFNYVTRALFKYSGVAAEVITKNEFDRDAHASDFVVGGKSHPKAGDLDYALVARIPLRVDGITVPCFVCGGRTPEGTVAATTFLCEHWRRLFRLYASSGKDFDCDALAVMLEYSPGALSAADIYHDVEPCFKALKHAV
jgi:hypothetical protein